MKTVDKYLKKELKHYYSTDKAIIDDFINNSLDKVDDLIAGGMSVELAHRVVIERLHDLSEFKESLTPINLKDRALSKFIYSIVATILIYIILLLLAYLFDLKLIYPTIIFVATLFWPLSMWLNYQNKRNLWEYY